MMGAAWGCAVWESFTIELVSSEKPTACYRVTPFEPSFSVMLLGGSVFGVPVAGSPGFAGAYLDAHFACSALAWNTPSLPKLPSASAWELSLKVSGGGSVPA